MENIDKFKNNKAFYMYSREFKKKSKSLFGSTGSVFTTEAGFISVFFTSSFRILHLDPNPVVESMLLLFACLLFFEARVHWAPLQALSTGWAKYSSTTGSPTFIRITEGENLLGSIFISSCCVKFLYSILIVRFYSILSYIYLYYIISDMSSLGMTNS